MHLIYTRHALTQMKSRNITMDEIVKVLNEFDVILNDNYGNKIAQKIIGKYLIRVIYRKEEPDRIIIITTYRTSNLKKYLRK